MPSFDGGSVGKAGLSSIGNGIDLANFDRLTDDTRVRWRRSAFFLLESRTTRDRTNRPVKTGGGGLAGAFAGVDDDIIMRLFRIAIEIKVRNQAGSGRFEQ